MADTEYNFQKELKNAIINADPKLNRIELLTDIFKSYVAKMFELVITKKGLPFESLVKIKENLITEFRSADLAEYQRSVEWYENLFNNTVKEILEYATARHSGQNLVMPANQNLEINPGAYIKEGGLFKPVNVLN